MSKKAIAVLTSGGDAPGMNAAVRAVVRAGSALGLEVLGCERGYNGLMNGDFVKMSMRSVSDIIHRGGTVLYSARSKEFREQTGIQKAVDKCKEHNICGVVVIGGDGSYRGARDLSYAGVPTVGLPGTIDNDISSTEYTIGFDTASNTAMEMIDKLRDTSASHDRCTVVEVMGRNAGWIALHTGIACGATAILVPEMKYDVDKDIIEKMKETQKSGLKHFIIVVAEGIGHVDELAKEIEAKTGIESRCCILGHVQRGGSPTVRDRVEASRMGYHAVELLAKGIGNRVVGLKDNNVVDYDITEGLNMVKPFDEHLYKIAESISI